MVFGHSTRSLAPAHRSAFAVEWHLSMEESGMTLTLVITSLASLKIGTDVSIQDSKSKEWNRVDVIVSVGGA